MAALKVARSSVPIACRIHSLLRDSAANMLESKSFCRPTTGCATFGASSLREFAAGNDRLRVGLLSSRSEASFAAPDERARRNFGGSSCRFFSGSRAISSMGPAGWIQRMPMNSSATGAALKVSRLDHVVLTVQDIEATSRFYAQVLGMEVVKFGAAGRVALAFGEQKINLHQVGNEFEPKGHRPTPGSADLCFIANTPLEMMQKHVAGLGVTIIEGPVARTGATGPIRSIYFRDPDLNLIEVANYV